MTISKGKNDGEAVGISVGIISQPHPAMGATSSEAKQDNLREVESQVAALQKLLSSTDSTDSTDKPWLGIWGSPPSDHLLKWFLR